MTEWEYKVVALPYNSTMKRQRKAAEAKLNELGAEGWEVVGIPISGMAWTMFLKRPVECPFWTHVRP